MKTLILIFLGGGTGSVFRYILSNLCSGLCCTNGFPLGTFLCNVCGCFLIGMFNSLTAAVGWGSDTRLMLTVGLCGGFTTFSTFSNEGLALIHSGNYFMYAIYLIASLVIGIAAVFLGSQIG